MSNPNALIVNGESVPVFATERSYIHVPVEVGMSVERVVIPTVRDDGLIDLNDKEDGTLILTLKANSRGADFVREQHARGQRLTLSLKW